MKGSDTHADDTFYGFVRRQGSTEMQESYWPDGPVELEPMVSVMKPSWERAESPIQ